MIIELIEGSHGRHLAHVAIAFLHHLILDNAKLLSYWAGCTVYTCEVEM